MLMKMTPVEYPSYYQVYGSKFMNSIINLHVIKFTTMHCTNHINQEHYLK